MKKYLSVLKQCPLFAGIEAENIPAMLGCIGGRVYEYGKNETIFMEGDPATQVGVVLSGAVQIIREDFYGKRSIMGSVHPGQLFGESFACAEIERMPVSVIATEKSEIMRIDCRRITMSCSNACAFHSRMILNLLGVVAAKNLMLNQKIEIMSQRSTKEKLMTYLLDQAKRHKSSEFTIPFDRQSLADYLGVERSALSAEISKLRGEGILETNRSYFKLL
ncbi:MAG: Crp/Fnr family transcriptional regulator [Clostridia bacterium]|nr:Crp/Fnr family transcriptional regulator [Clostridia bacterium]